MLKMGGIIDDEVGLVVLMDGKGVMARCFGLSGSLLPFAGDDDVSTGKTSRIRSVRRERRLWKW